MNRHELTEDLRSIVERHKETYDHFDAQGAVHAFTKQHPELNVVMWVCTEMSGETPRRTLDLTLEGTSATGYACKQSIEVTW